MTIATTHPTSENAIDETNLYQAYHHDLVQNQSSLFDIRNGKKKSVLTAVTQPLNVLEIAVSERRVLSSWECG